MLVAIALVLPLVACGGGGGSTPSSPSPHTASGTSQVTVNAHSGTLAHISPSR
ncbi:MAG TPA: hypothetical protein VFA60_03930 [Terriglobales bacterium]|nr:hypothetical protein [Terriglobales bacterium]